MSRTTRPASVLPILAALTLGGCAAPLGRLPLLPTEDAASATKLLRPGVEGRSCRTSVFGVSTAAPGDPSVGEALAQLVALDPEGNAVANAEVRWERLLTGVYNRRCVVVQGDLVRTISTLTVPMPGGHHHPH